MKEPCHTAGILISCGKESCFSGRSRKAALRAGCT